MERLTMQCGIMLSTVLIVSSDSDTWVYGLGLYETGLLAEKVMIVKRGSSSATDQYVHVN